MSGIHRAAFFDMNGTLMRGEPGWQLLILLRERGYCSDAEFGQVEECLRRFRRHEVANEILAEELFGTIRSVLAGLSVAEIMERYAERHREVLRPSIFPSTPSLVAKLRSLGCVTYAVTNIPIPLLDLLMADIGLERAIAPELEQVDGRFTSRILNWEGPHLGKGDWVRAVAERERIDMAASFAFGDGEGDATFLELVGHPLAVNPTPALTAIAEARGWPIVRGTSVLEEVTSALGL